MHWSRVANAANEWDGSARWTCIQEALALDETNPELLNNLAWYSLKAGDGDLESITAIAKQPGKGGQTIPTSSIPIARCCFEPVRACLASTSSRGSRASPIDLQLLYRLARAYHLDGDGEFARLTIERCRRLVIDIDPWPLRDDKGVFERFRAELHPGGLPNDG